MICLGKWFCGTIFTIILTGESILLGWELGAVLLLLLGLGVSWGIYVTEKLPTSIQIWLYFYSSINDILDMSKIESGKMDIVPVAYNVGDMLSDIVNMIWVRAKEKDISFHIDVDQAMPAQLFSDEVRIKQILINVLNNAVKYTSEGSVTLSIQCKRMESGRAQISYSVTDTGMGIKKENIPYLFSAFKRVDQEKNRYIEGTGLGLSIVKQLVDLMDGDIAVNSVYQKGTLQAEF